METEISNRDIALPGSDPGPVVARGTPNPTSSQPLNGVPDPNKIPPKSETKIDLSQLLLPIDQPRSDTESTGNGVFRNYTSFRVGQLDPSMGVKIKEILRVNDRFIVYIDEKFDLQWYWYFPLDPDTAAKVFNRAGDLEAKTQFLRQKEDQEDNLNSALRLIGEGVVELFSTKDVAYANAALDTADKFITQRAREVSRRWYFIPSLIFFAISALVILGSYIYDPTLTKQIAIICTFAGGVGAFISRALDNDNTPISATAGRMVHWIEATLRWCIGLTAGLIVWLLVTGNIAGSFLNTNAGQNTFALVAIALLAGASERLLPSLIQTFDESIKKNNAPQPPS
jgi:hypothetical protein